MDVRAKSVQGKRKVRARWRQQCSSINYCMNTSLATVFLQEVGAPELPSTGEVKVKIPADCLKFKKISSQTILKIQLFSRPDI